jgi:hypothetical protein
VLLGLETDELISKPVSLLYDPTMLCERAISLARSIDSIHSCAELFKGSPVVTEVFVSSKV